MEAAHAVIDVRRPQADSGPALPDLDALVAEVGASYPLLAFASMAGGEDDAEREPSEALDSLILAGLVTP